MESKNVNAKVSPRAEARPGKAGANSAYGESLFPSTAGFTNLHLLELKFASVSATEKYQPQLICFTSKISKKKRKKLLVFSSSAFHAFTNTSALFESTDWLESRAGESQTKREGEEQVVQGVCQCRALSRLQEKIRAGKELENGARVMKGAGGRKIQWGKTGLTNNGPREMGLAKESRKRDPGGGEKRDTLNEESAGGCWSRLSWGTESTKRGRMGKPISLECHIQQLII